MRAMEKFTQEVGGYPFLYADIFMTRKEFEEMFDLTGKKNFVKSITKFGRNLNGFFQLTNKYGRNITQMGPFHTYTTKLNPKSTWLKLESNTWIPCRNISLKITFDKTKSLDFVKKIRLRITKVHFSSHVWKNMWHS